DGHIPTARLVQARNNAEQALTIMETLGISRGIWETLGILADLAETEGRTEAAQQYRQRERETYAAFVGNRDYIDRLHGRLIANIAAAAKGDERVRGVAKADLPGLEARGWYIATAARRIWAGERDWRSLTEYLHRDEALLVLRVLETIAQSTETQGSNA